jgi:hypothetical protein
MLGVDAVDAILFGGNAEGVEATFNSPSKVNNRYRPYNRKVDAAAELAAARPRADGSARAHARFTLPPTHLAPLATWSAVAWHCRESDVGWSQAFKALVPDGGVKFFAHSYERCGVGDVKRPAAAMLHEGLHHLDRIPHGAPPTNASALAHHAVAFAGRLPERLLFVRPGADARALPASLRGTLGAASFGLAVVAGAGGGASEPMALTPALCAVYRAALGLDAAAACPDAATIVPGWVVLAASGARVGALPKARWEAIVAALDADTSAAGAEAAERLFLGMLPALLGATLPLGADQLVALQ